MSSASNAVSVLARLDDQGVVSGLKKIKVSMEEIKGKDGKLNWEGLKKGGAATKALGEGITDLGSSMTLGLTVPIVAAGGAAISVAANFDDAMSQVQGALGDASADTEGLRQLALQLGSDTVFSATEAAQAMVELAKGGLTEADIKGGALAASMDLAAAGQLNLADAAETTVQMMGSFGLGAGDATRIANALAGAANASSADVSDLTQAMSQCSAQASLAGWSLEDTAAALALFADHGVKGSDAGTSLKTMLQRLSAPTDQAADAMEAYGLEVRDSNGKMKDITGIADELTGKLGTLSDAERDAALQTIFGSDASRAAAILMQSGSEGLQKYIAATNDATAAETMANAQKGELSWALENMGGAIESASIAFGSALAPAITAVAGVIGNVAEAFASLPSGAQTAIAVVLALVAAVGPLLVVFGSVVAMLSALSEGLLMLGGAFAVPLAPALAVAAAIAAVVAVLVTLWNTSETFRATVLAAVDAISAKVQEICAFLAPYVQAFVDQLVLTVQAAMDVLLPIIEAALTVIIAIVVPVLTSIMDTVANVFATILATVTNVMAALSSIIQGAWQVIQGIFQTVLGLIVGVVTGDFSMMSSGVSGILNGMSSIISGILQGILSVFSGIWNSIKSVAVGACNAVTGAVSGAFNGIRSVIENAMSGAKSTVSNALDAISGFFAGLHLEFPHIALPHFSLSGEFSLMPPSVPSISVSWYRTGAIAMGASVVGIGEAGPEAVVPLSGREMDPYADAVARRLAARGADARAGGTVVYNIGDVTVSMEQLRDLATLEDFVNLVLAAKRANPTRTRG
ncbi:phage tail tape measure protein [Eggerthella lenta]|uniref:phage tail tape measure protein n=1 Tax=Eggerthella lenta TaxID=84112 RepID=UPI000DF70194|nr:phage tail tape measure protein [Eggerthella lenta]RDB76385.1 phage tail tape measure protein [Eggerthella lenta]